MPGRDAGRQRIAVIGTGISGLSAAWLLNGSADIRVFERSSYIGGHTRTVDVMNSNGLTPVDMGFIVYNEHTYPNLTALFEHLDVATKTTDMSLAVSLKGGKFEYAGGCLSQLFVQKRNFLRLRFWQMLRDLVRFYRTAPGDLGRLKNNDMTLGDYLFEKRYTDAFRDDHLLPMAAAIWSMPTSDVLQYPAHAFIQFHNNHGLLNLINRPLWRTVSGGSRTYVEKLTGPFQDRIETGVGIQSVERGSDGVVLQTNTGRREFFDQVVIATHADHALAMLSDPTPEENQLLGAFRYTTNQAILHGDDRLMPKRRRAWASWNYVGSEQPDIDNDLTVTYWMNNLQGLPNHEPLFVTLNPNREIDGRRVFQTQLFEHPIIDGAAAQAQKHLWTIQGCQGVWYCGAYFGSGFHEDGLQSGLAVAEAITGQKRPWCVEEESGRIHVRPLPRGSSVEGMAA